MLTVGPAHYREIAKYLRRNDLDGISRNVSSTRIDSINALFLLSDLLLT